MNRLVFSFLMLLVAVPSTSFAHKVWLLPSQTVFSGPEPWLTVDAAVSNDLFYFNHFPLGLDNLVVVAPDGTQVEAENKSTGKYRSVFDLPLTQQGTYRVAVVNNGAFASWEENGKRRRWRGSADAIASEIPADASNLRISESVGRVETFVTNGAPTEESLQPTGVGIELLPVTHPNDLYAGETATFRFLVNGKPAKDLEISVVQGGTRYRNSQEEQQLKTNENGEFEVAFGDAGMYWIETSHQDEQTKIERASSRRMSYAGTLEVLPQ
ncbi:DUF4198 domain-containing protein [Rhodopirellula halodulae]|uniref:DUF4198 domain-containing protein n=1 Tax=Rhodopirellula halodulae TaxID=2894198 RepID=UPI001E5937AA|nr:DUF4198 domain-containing protein [Rhodopirellula sp. JC737]MCC9656186.1 DUF4198 domain-containing protein [Rhodopirellula sp. JC737]